MTEREPEDTPVPVGFDPADSPVDEGPQDDYEDEDDGVPV